MRDVADKLWLGKFSKDMAMQLRELETARIVYKCNPVVMQKTEEFLLEEFHHTTLRSTM